MTVEERITRADKNWALLTAKTNKRYTAEELASWGERELIELILKLQETNSHE